MTKERGKKSKGNNYSARTPRTTENQRKNREIYRNPNARAPSDDEGTKAESDYLGFDVTDLGGEEGGDARPLGNALQVLQLFQIQPELLLIRHVHRLSLSLSS